jgi:hypothetical protein
MLKPAVMEKNMLKFWYDMSMLGFEAQQVIWLRTMKIAMGGKAGQREAVRMVSEKLVAAQHAGANLAMGKSVNSVVSGYRKKVRANRRRLSR